MEFTSFVKMRLVFEDGKNPYFGDVSSLFHDLELLYDLSLLLYVEEYDNYRFSQYFWYRGGQPLKDGHKLRASRILKESPLTVELIAALVSPAAIWAFVQTVESVSSWRLNREQLELEVQKLQHENNVLRYKEREAEIELENRLLDRDALRTRNRLLKRFERNPIKLAEMDLTSERIDSEHRE